MLQFEGVYKFPEPQVPSTHLIYAVLGFLTELPGRYIIQDSDLIERFGDRETKKADIFEKYLLRLIDESNLSTTLRKESYEKWTSFFSAELAQLINSFYLKYHVTEIEANGNLVPPWGKNCLHLSYEIFQSGDREAKLSYLIGSHQRHAEENIFLFANQYNKAQLIHQLLLEFKCNNVVFIYPDSGRAPAPYRVAFEPTPELIERLCLQAFACIIPPEIHT